MVGFGFGVKENAVLGTATICKYIVLGLTTREGKLVVTDNQHGTDHRVSMAPGIVSYWQDDSLRWFQLVSGTWMLAVNMCLHGFPPGFIKADYCRIN